MCVEREVVYDVKLAVRLLGEASDASTHRLTDVWTLTKRASALAARAYFNPNMVGLLYFVSPYTICSHVANAGGIG
jgi:hypothetical protein